MLRTGSLAATGTVDLGDAGDDSITSWIVQITGTWTGDLVTQGYLGGKPTMPASGTALAASAATDIAYKPADTGVLTDPGSTAITANGIYIVPSDGMHVVLDWTRSSGTLVYHARPLRG